MTIKTLAVIALVITAIIVSSFRLQNHSVTLQAKTSRHFDIFMEQAEAKIFDLDGKLKWHAKAKHWYHYPDDNTTQLQQPEFTVYNTKENSWDINSDSATMQHLDNNQVESIKFIKNVGLNLNSSDSLMKLTTSSLDYIPKKAEISSLALVNIDYQHNQLTGTGFIGNLNTEVIHLNQRVRGQYAAEAPNT